MTWNQTRTNERIAKALRDFSSIEARPLGREVNLQQLPLNLAYRVDGVHVYLNDRSRFV